ncbi:sensor histidine kinase [Wenzhouxiangella sp. XN201]|uniref:sensor histidine kinase n=1 Tax=Wenzhouxiangella sp. XN201 TaxID=2710755 RepID=UPI0013C66B45|nr:sensor histidine kinase [Wenzhouxiangella sp. XN201]NEZ04825.1 sensor histidine kinase [Wenzhouxiangella sp. XN201]
MAHFHGLFSRRRRKDSLQERVEALAHENQRLFSELEDMQRDFSHLARSTWRVQEDERRHLARELHDHLGQMLTALVHSLERSPEDRARSVELARKALEDTRELSRVLRPQVLDDLGLGAALEWLGRRAGETAGIEVSVSVEGLPEESRDADLESLLFRISQEALNNVVKHARASQASLSLTRSGNSLELRIRDDGVGFEPDRKEVDEERGIGLAGMSDRVRLFGGQLAISSAPGRGTAITVTVRLDSQSSMDAGSP